MKRKKEIKLFLFKYCFIGANISFYEAMMTSGKFVLLVNNLKLFQIFETIIGFGKII